MTKNDSVMLIYSNARWRVVETVPKLWQVSADNVTWAAQQDNYARGDRGSSYIRVTLTGDQTLTGVVPDGAAEGFPGGELLVIQNIDSTNTLTIAHDVTSTAGNRFTLPGSANLRLGPGHAAMFRNDGTSTRWRLISGTQGSATGALLATTYTSGSGTHTYAAGTRRVRIRQWSGGGGGGGVDGSVGATNDGAAGGGGGGGYDEGWFDVAVGATSSYTVGAGGAGGTGSAAGSGSSGGSTSTTELSTTGPGTGGNGVTADANVKTNQGGLGGGGAGSGTLTIAGSPGGRGTNLSGLTVAGDGGASPQGGGSQPGQGSAATAVGAAGVAGIAPGGGGSGAYSNNQATDRNGGAGARGEVIYEEYS